MLPDSAAGLRSAQVDEVARGHVADLLAGLGTVSLPVGLRSMGAERALFWQWLFAASGVGTNPAGGERRRFRLDPTAIQKATRKAALAAGVRKRASCPTLRHSFGVHVFEAGADVRIVPTLPGHRSAKKTMIYTHVVQRGPLGVVSPHHF